MLTERDSAWVDVVDDLRWIDGGKRFTWVSERDGWRHLYVVSRDGSTSRLVTPGDFDLHNPGSAFGQPYVRRRGSAAGWIYFTASPDNATQLYLYRSRLDGKGKQERVTPARPAGLPHLQHLARRPLGVPHQVVVRHAADDRSGPAARARVGAHPDRQPALSATRWRACAAGPAEFFRVDAARASSSTAWMMKPPGFDSTKRYPVLFHVYGEPAGQTVLDQWDGGKYLWHLMLAQLGYVVA